VRELLAEEMRFVAGGLKPQDPVNPGGITVYPDPGSGGGGLPYSPPSTGGGQGGDGGGGGHSGGSGGGGLTSQQLAGIARIKAQLGVDLTAYAQMSPTLAQEIANATATWNFNFAYDPAGSHLTWNDQVSGTIYINSAYQNNINQFLEGLSHELGHVDHSVWENPVNVTSQQYVNDNLISEGFATLSNERVQHEILAASGVDIGISGNQANRATYDAEYARYSSGLEGMTQAATAMGTVYGQSELAMGNVNYHDYYLNIYHQLGGTQ
jgi:hypothetical protein